jgi:hypothetical protein
MSLGLILVFLVALAVYWFYTQIRPERQKQALLRRSLGDGLFETLNERRHGLGVPLLEPDDELMTVAESKAVHQVMTGQTDEGWDYPAEYRRMFGCSLLMEALIVGPAEHVVERLCRQKDALDGEWIRAGIGVAGGRSGELVVALVLCREAWEPAPEVMQAQAVPEAR